MATFLNQAKHSATMQNSRKAGVATWDDNGATWDDTEAFWDNKTTTFSIANQSKNSASFTNLIKN